MWPSAQFLPEIKFFKPTKPKLCSQHNNLYEKIIRRIGSTKCGDENHPRVCSAASQCVRPLMQPNICVFGCNKNLMILITPFRIDECNLCLKFGDENHPKSLLAGLLACIPTSVSFGCNKSLMIIDAF